MLKFKLGCYKYEAVRKGMDLFLKAGAEAVEIFWRFEAGDFSAHGRI